MLMWEMVTSTMPWERMTVGQVFFAVVQEDARPPVPEELPEAYQNLMTVETECLAMMPIIYRTLTLVLTRFSHDLTAELSENVTWAFLWQTSFLSLPVRPQEEVVHAGGASLVERCRTHSCS